MTAKLTLLLAFLAIVVPIGAAITMNWENVRQYLASEGSNSPGELYFFSDRRG